ncbi:PHP domain-containing protein [Cellulomonas sp. ICMP 17802]|uniref:PHP domain-containing protein n=1 Tax=Cellulomonas sp. ICMP 17802 TaxID=3239199 RepID=UPI00351BA7F5
MRIDLHTHSTASDGTEAPAQVVAAAAAAGLDVVALTDHDTTAGWADAEDAARHHGIALVRGTEVSARAAGISIHLLSYLQDPAHPALAVELDRTRDARLNRARQIVELLAADVPITWDDVLAQSRDAVVVGRPHIADALVARGVVPDRDAAFAHLLASSGPYHVPHYAPDGTDAVRAIRAAGGVPVFAHPGADARGHIVPDRVFDRLAAAGLAGLEVHHRDHSPAQRARLTAIADRLGLLVTGSSDYHGDGKANRLGENLTAPEVLAAIEEQGTTKVVRP